LLDGRDAIVALADGSILRSDGRSIVELVASSGHATADLSLCGETIVAVDASRRALRAYDAGGSLRWSVAVPFPLTQPPLDGGRERVYAVGHGLVAIDDGRLAWHVAARERVYATSLGRDGIVVGCGPWVDHVDRDGTTRMRAETPDRSICCTPPAASASGELHLGTTSGLYILR
jgi:hypothetical protein